VVDGVVDEFCGPSERQRLGRFDMNIPKLLQLTLVIAGLVAFSLPVHAESAFDEPPTPVKTQPPRYPETLKREGISGMVSISVTIDEKGTVSEAKVTKSTNAGFDQPALDAVTNWKFKPAKKNGQPVSVTVVLPIRFSN